MNSCLPTDGLRALHAICRTCNDLRHDPESAHQILVEQVVALIGGDRGISIVGEIDADRSPRVLHAGGFTGKFAWDSEDRLRYERFLKAGPLLTDGGIQYAVRGLGSATLLTGSSRTAWTQEQWDAGIDGRCARGLGGLADVAFATFASVPPRGPRRVFGLAVHRLKDGRAVRPFNESELQMLELLNTLRYDDFRAGEFGELLSWREPIEIELTPAERFCYHAFVWGATQDEIARELERRGLESGFVDRSRVWRRLCSVAKKYGLGCPNDLRTLPLPLRRTLE